MCVWGGGVGCGEEGRLADGDYVTGVHEVKEMRGSGKVWGGGGYEKGEGVGEEMSC